ncbi:MAG: deoxynucleoside kinase [Bacillota bacterium]|nr:deoxynucleoside kinase [Bacillota bacterium]
MSGKLIVIEGLDASGKETQSKLLLERLEEKGINARRVEFPNYASNSSALVKMYLAGEFGTEAGDVNPYAASSFYAVDRYATWKQGMEKFYERGDIIVADRYTTSNIIHQAGKIKDETKRKNFVEWLYDYEFEKLGLPKPDVVIFLHMPVEVSISLMENRRNKAGTEGKDIHESDYNYLKETYTNALNMCDLCGFKRVECCSGGNVRTIEDIHNDIMSIVMPIL